MEIWKAKEWQTTTGKWRVGLCSHFSTDYCQWWYPARIFGVSLDEFVLMLVNKYKVSDIRILGDSQLSYCWDNYTYAHRFLLDLNKQARNKKIYILDKNL